MRRRWRAGFVESRLRRCQCAADQQHRAGDQDKTRGHGEPLSFAHHAAIVRSACSLNLFSAAMFRTIANEPCSAAALVPSADKILIRNITAARALVDGANSEQEEL